MVCLYFSYMLEATEWGGNRFIMCVGFFFNIKTLKAFNL